MQYLGLVVYFILGCLFSRADAGLLDSLGGVIGLGINQNRPQFPPINNNNNFNPNYNPNYRPNPNNNFDYNRNMNNPNMNNPNMNNPNRNNPNMNNPNMNNEGFREEANDHFDNNNENPNDRGSDGNSNGNNMRFIDPSNGFDYDFTTKRNIPNRGNLELTDKEMIAAQKFPELQKLLEKLKEMNRQKELEKQNNMNKPTAGNTNNNGGETVTQNPTGAEAKNGWKKLTRRRFLFRARPVRPANEVVREDDVVYYLD